MKKRFNVTGLCLPERHYMADISERLEEMKAYVDAGDYFTVNRARQPPGQPGRHRPAL